MSDKEATQVKVWDVPVRVFHWMLVAGFVTAYLSAEMHKMGLHVWVGYTLVALLLFRVVWGFTGNQYARFKSFIFTLQETLAYVRGIRSGHAKHYYGHNPAGALMVFALLAVLLAIFGSGLVTLAVIDFEGPLLFLANEVSDETAYLFRDAHDWMVNIALILIPLHLLGVVSGSLQHKENLVRAMVTGMKRKVPTEG
ncbi:cytochrome b/b6 domain-containing protein [Sideroxydans sp.]